LHYLLLSDKILSSQNYKRKRTRMPIHIPIYINDRLIKTYHIGRLEGDTNTDSINTYLIVESNGDRVPWETGIEFIHRYADGLDICVQKGFIALELPGSDSTLDRLSEYKQILKPEV